MPYVKPKDRYKLDLVVRVLQLHKIKANGDLNYILFKFFKESVPKDYNSVKNYLGELDEVRVEIRRRFLAPYEDFKIEENGDV